LIEEEEAEIEDDLYEYINYDDFDEPTSDRYEEYDESESEEEMDDDDDDDDDDDAYLEGGEGDEYDYDYDQYNYEEGSGNDEMDEARLESIKEEEEKKKYFDFTVPLNTKHRKADGIVAEHKASDKVQSETGVDMDMDDEKTASSSSSSSRISNTVSMSKKRRIPVVCIVGRPNVGKSRLANRISEEHHFGAIVHDEVNLIFKT
jgi:hypothetical protein